MAHWFCEKHQ